CRLGRDRVMVPLHDSSRDLLSGKGGRMENSNSDDEGWRQVLLAANESLGVSLGVMNA
ncbi:hypothetical protein HAX54_012817, partial [Datura stramonium]|nr:hypothetical protein [Datura stramonium]